MSEIVERIAKALERLPIRDRDNPGGELDKLRLREAARAVIGEMREPTYEVSLRECSDVALRHEVVRRGLM